MRKKWRKKLCYENLVLSGSSCILGWTIWVNYLSCLCTWRVQLVFCPVKFWINWTMDQYTKKLVLSPGDEEPGHLELVKHGDQACQHYQACISCTISWLLCHLMDFCEVCHLFFPQWEAASDRNSVFVEQVVIADVNVDCRCWLITAWTDSKVIFLQNYHDFSELILKNWLRHLFLLFTSMSSRAVINNGITFVETILCNGGIIENFCFFW